MKRNFVKISLSVVVLILALACCLTGCDDTTKAEIETIKENVTANQTKIDEVIASLDTAKADLDNKIAANTTKIDTEVAALNTAIANAQAALEEADAAGKTALETAIADAKAELQTAIDAVAADLATAKTELSDKIAANTTKIDTEVANLNTSIANAQAALEAADTANKTALEKAIADAKAELKAAIDKVTADLEAAKTDLGNKIASNTTKIDSEVANLNTAIANAQAALEAADAANKTALEKAIADAKTELTDALEAAKTELLEKIEALETYAKAEDIKLRGEIDGVRDALEKSAAADVLDLLDKINAANEAIDANTKWIAEYKATTEKVVEAVFGVEKVWTLCNTYCVGWGEIAADELLYVKEQAKVYLYRATNEDDIKAAVERFYTAIDEMDTLELRRLNNIHDLLIAAKASIDEGELTDAVEKLAEARVLFDEIGMDKCTDDVYDVLIIDGKAVDLSDIYSEYRLTIISLLIDGAETALDRMDTATADTYLGNARTLIDEVIADAMTTELEGVDLVERYNDVRVAVIGVYLAQAEEAIENAEFASADDYLADARDDIDEIEADEITTDLEAVKTSYNEVRVALINAYLAKAEEAIENAEFASADDYLADARVDIDEIEADEITTDLEAVKTSYNEVRVALINAYLAQAEEAITDGDISVATDYLADARVDIDEIAEDTITTDLVTVIESYNNVRIMVVTYYLDLADEAINNAEDKADVDNTDDVAWQYTLKAEVFTATISADGVDVTELTAKIAAVRDRFHAKYVDLYAVELTDSMNNYVGHLDAIYGDIGVNNMDAIKDEFTALKDHAIYSNYFGASASDVVTTLVATADKLDDAIDVRTTLISLNMQGDNVAEIIEGYTVEGIVGTKSESELLIEYKGAYEIFIANLDAMYEGFEDNDTHRAVYDAIEKKANKTDFDALKAAFDAKIYPLTDYGQKFIDSVEALQEYTADGFKFNTGEKISAAKAAKDAWLAQSADVDSVAFVIEYCSDGTWTHSQLVKEIYDIEGAYNAWLVQAAADWAAAYTDTGVGTLTVDNITIYETRLEAVRAWFNTYPHDATEDIYGTEETYSWLTDLEEGLDALKNKVKAEADRVQELIDRLKGDDTLTANRLEVETARAAYDAWVAGTYSAGVNAVQIAIISDSVFDTVDITNLLVSEAKLAELDAKISEIKDDIDDLAVPTFNDMTKNYFADDGARNAYAETVDEIAGKIEAFKAVNGGDLTVFTAEELKKVEDCKLYTEKYDSLVKLNSAYADVTSRVEDTDTVTLGKLASYYNDAIAKMKDIHSESVFKDSEGNVVTTTTPSIQIGIIGNNAALDLATIAGINA